MRAIPAMLLLMLALASVDAHAQPLSDRIVAPPPPPGMSPRSGTYSDPSAAAKGQFDWTVRPQRPVKARNKKRRS